MSYLNHKACILTLSLIAVIDVSAIEIAPLQPVGYLEVGYSPDGWLAPNRNTVINCHLFNISDAPISMEITQFEYLPSVASIMLPGEDYSPEKEYGAWGPPIGDEITLVDEHVAVSGSSSYRDIPNWEPKRPYITLFRNEGYARKLYLNAGWIKGNSIPSNTKILLLNFSPILKIWLPKKTPDAVVPSKPIVFDAPLKVYAPGDRAIPYVAQPPENLTRKVNIGKDNQSGLSLEVQLPRTLHPNQDLKMIYLVGNQGKNPILIDQNSLIPAYLKTKILYANHEVASLNGDELKMLADLFPERKPIPLFPGEHLSFKHVIPAADIGLKYNGQYDFFIELTPKWHAIDDKALESPKSSRLISSISVMTRL